MRRILNSSIIMSWSSILSRLGMALLVLPFIIVFLDEQSISIWFFFLILNRLRDIFDFGYLDNVSRHISYIKGGGESNSEISTLYLYAGHVYKRSALACFIISFFIGSVGLFIKGFNVIENWQFYLALLVISLSNSIFIYGNRYISILFGMDYISKIKSWDTLFTILNILSLLCFLNEGVTVLILVTINSFWLILCVFRNGIMLNRIFNDLNLNVNLLGKGNYNFNLIRDNARREFVASLFSVGYFQLFNFIISLYLPTSISNTYLFLDNVVDQIKNLSRVPFYVKRPGLASEFKRNGNLKWREISTYMARSHFVLLLGLFSFSIVGPYILELIGSNVVYDKLLWGTISIYAFCERLTAMHSQVNILVTDKIKSHIYLPKTTLMSSLGLLLCVLFKVEYYYFPLCFAVSYLTVFYAKLSTDNYRILNVSMICFEAVTMRLVVFFIFLGIAVFLLL